MCRIWSCCSYVTWCFLLQQFYTYEDLKFEVDSACTNKKRIILFYVLKCIMKFFSSICRDSSFNSSPRHEQMLLKCYKLKFVPDKISYVLWWWHPGENVQHIIDRLSHYITFLTKYPQVHSENSASKDANKDHCDHLKLLLCEVITFLTQTTLQFWRPVNHGRSVM